MKVGEISEKIHKFSSTLKGVERMEADVMPLLESRMYAYNLLKKTFLEEPKRKFCSLIKEHDIIRSFPFRNESNLIQEGVNQVQKYLESKNLTDEDDFQELHWDYTRLFIGPDKLPSPTWESAYTNEEHLLFQRETLDVRKCYLEYDLLPKYYRVEADDHIGLELDFMFQLSNLTIMRDQGNSFKSYEKILEDQLNFLEGHLNKWIPLFCHDVYYSALTDFYKGMAKILNGFINMDTFALKELRGVLIQSC